MRSLTMEQLSVGDAAEFTKTVTETDVAFFAAISGDFNPVHVDAEWAKRSLFGARVAHGPLTLALAAGLLGMDLPGVGTIAETNHIDYRRPVYIGDTIRTRGEVAERDVERNRVRIALTWTNQDGALVAEGYAVVMPPKSAQL
ncbi:MAG TPA: MaoC family dehydratase [Thermoleophilaceae bacterium]|jgi:3-hydroxybutyryl-CoA dehydratase